METLEVSGDFTLFPMGHFHTEYCNKAKYYFYVEHAKQGFCSWVDASGQIGFLECFPTKNTGIGQQ